MPIIAREGGMQVDRAAFMRPEAGAGRKLTEAEALTQQIIDMLISVADRLSPVLLAEDVPVKDMPCTPEPPSSKLVQDLRSIRVWIERFDSRIAL